MAQNEVFHDAEFLSVTCSYPASPDAGDPVLLGELTGVALTDERADGKTSVDFGTRVWDLSVVDSVGGGIAVGDTLFLDAAASAVSNLSTGKFFGFALEAIGAGLTATINVLHVASPGSGVLGSGTVGTTQLANDAVTAAKFAGADGTAIVVSAGGNDTTGDGTWAFPFKTIAKAITVWNATRHTIYVLGGEYSEAAITWPNVTGLALVGLGDVVISNSDSAAAVVTISPTFTASTFEATIKNVALEADTQIGLKIANANMTKKLNVYLEGVTASMDTSGDSIDVAGTVSGQAIRVYAKGLDLEGLLHFTVNDAGSRLRVQNSRLIGGLTGAGAVAAEVTLRDCEVLTSGLTVDGAQQLTNVGCVYVTDADPAVYTELANAYAT